MKKLQYFLPFIALFVSACDSDDDGFYNTVYIQTAELVTVDNPAANYNTGDVVFVTAHVPAFIDEPGYSEPLDVRKTTGNADQFDFSFFVEKKNAAGDWEFFPVNPGDYVAGVTGSSQVELIVRGVLNFDPLAQQYLFEGGIRFNEPGEYRLNFSNATDYADKVFLRSLSKDNNIIIDIYSGSAGLPGGLFTFTVN